MAVRYGEMEVFASLPLSKQEPLNLVADVARFATTVRERRGKHG